jgi:enamine deaminase RidA (YjgF/YER057c/UK114 family)
LVDHDRDPAVSNGVVGVAVVGGRSLQGDRHVIEEDAKVTQVPAQSLHLGKHVSRLLRMVVKGVPEAGDRRLVVALQGTNVVAGGGEVVGCDGKVVGQDAQEGHAVTIAVKGGHGTDNQPHPRTTRSAHDTTTAAEDEEAMVERQRSSSGSPWEPIFGYSRAIRADRLVFVSGTVGRNPDGTTPPDGYGQATRALEIIEAALKEVGAALDQVVRTRVFVTDINLFEQVARAHSQAFGSVLPATSLVEVSRLIDPAYLVEIEALAVVD